MPRRSSGVAVTDLRMHLSPSEVNILETQVLPTARRWLRTMPHLAPHAVQTLTHWGEQLVDDLGRPYVSDAQKRAAIIAAERARP